MEKVNWDRASPMEAPEICKHIFRQVGDQVTRDEIKRDPQNLHVRYTILTLAARAAQHQIASLFNRAAKDLPELNEYICVKNDGQVQVANQTGFNTLIADTAKQVMEKELKEDEKETRQANNRKGGSSRREAIERNVGMLCPLAKKAVNVRIRRDDGSITDSPEQQLDALALGWAPTLAHKDIDEDSARKLIRQYGGTAGPHRPAATEGGRLRILRVAKHSAPGPDGIPYACWRAAGKTGAFLLARQGRAICDGASPPTGFNHSIAAFLPKGSERDDSRHEVIRQAQDTRPLALKNCDNNSHAAVNNWAMAGPIAAHADHDQRGFVKGRQGLSNVTDIEA